MPLLVSKFFQPRLPAHLVARPHLLEQLDAGLQAGSQLTLISAPAGYGKSTLAAAWVGRLSRPVAWLSLEEADDEPVHFLAYLFAALQKLGIDLGPELPSAVAAGQIPAQGVLLSELSNRLAQLESPVLLVLDDFQHIQDAHILHLLQGLLAHPSPQFHLVIVTREDPPLPLARLRVHAQLSEVRAASLRFVGEEIERFMQKAAGIALSPEQLARLAERTEGWIAGLQLASLALQSQPERQDPAEFVASLTGSHRFILSFLTEEVLRHQPPEVQAFLLETSILTSLTGDLCDAVTGGEGGTAHLEALLAAGLFLIPLDAEGRWYRYHHLFAELLAAQLRRTAPAREPVLQQRASQWYAEHEMPVEAIDHALKGRDYPRMAALLETHAWSLLNQGYARKVEAWLGSVPEAYDAFSPRLYLDFAWMHLLRGSFPLVTPYLEQAEEALERQETGGAGQAELRGEILALQANLLQAAGDVPGSLAVARRALEIISDENARIAGLAWLSLGGAYRQQAAFDPANKALQEAVRLSQISGDWVTHMLAVAHLTLMALQYGQLHFAEGIARQALVRMRSQDAALPPIAGAVYSGLGIIYYEWNRVEEARQHLTEGIRLADFTGHNASGIYGRTNLARVEIAAGDLGAAARLLAEANKLIEKGAPGWVRPDFLARQAHLHLAQNDPVGARALLYMSRVGPDSEIQPQTDALHLAWLRVLSAEGDPGALPLAERIVNDAGRDERNGTLLQALVLGAVLQANNLPAAGAWLQQALALAEPENFLRVFLDEGAPLADLMQRLGMRQFLALFDEIPLPTAPAREPPAGEVPLQQLSERELEVLRLLAEGLTYAQIAARLVISLNTVRFHIKGIYGKLGVNKVSQALDQAQRWGIL